MALKIAYIGSGGFSNQSMFPQLHRHGVELSAICDLDEQRARHAARQYGFAGVYTDFRCMLDRERPDAVFCVGGPKVHFAVGLEVLQRGFPLYVQKPAALSAEQTLALADAASRSKVVCHVGFNLRSTPAVMQARKIISSAEFGDATMMIVRYGLMNGPSLRSVVLEQHCHAVDLMLHLSGKPARIQAQWGQKGKAQAYTVALGFADGGVGSLCAVNQQGAAKEFLYFEISGPQQRFLTCHDLELVYRTPGDQPDIHFARTGAYRVDRLVEFGYVQDVGSFLNAVNGEAVDPCPVADTVDTMRTCEEIYRQLREQGAPE